MLSLNNTPTPEQLVGNIALLTVQLQHDLDRNGTRAPLYTHIREIRHALNTLEVELHEDLESPHGDAC